MTVDVSVCASVCVLNTHLSSVEIEYCVIAFSQIHSQSELARVCLCLQWHTHGATVLEFIDVCDEP